MRTFPSKPCTRLHDASRIKVPFVVTCSASGVVSCSSASRSGNPENANGSPPPNATSSVPAPASPRSTAAAEATVHVLSRRTSREQNAHARLQAFVMPNIATRGAVRRTPRVAAVSTRTFIPDAGWKYSSAPSRAYDRKVILAALEAGSATGGIISNNEASPDHVVGANEAQTALASSGMTAFEISSTARSEMFATQINARSP